MLVLSRREGERIQIGDSITITVCRISATGVRIGIEAPPEAVVVRQELLTPGKSGPPQTREERGRKSPQTERQ